MDTEPVRVWMVRIEEPRGPLRFEFSVPESWHARDVGPENFELGPKAEGPALFGRFEDLGLWQERPQPSEGGDASGVAGFVRRWRLIRLPSGDERVVKPEAAVVEAD